MISTGRVRRLHSPIDIQRVYHLLRYTPNARRLSLGNRSWRSGSSQANRDRLNVLSAVQARWWLAAGIAVAVAGLGPVKGYRVPESA
jgi:hypothetical protein